MRLKLCLRKIIFRSEISPPPTFAVNFQEFRSTRQIIESRLAGRCCFIQNIFYTAVMAFYSAD